MSIFDWITNQLFGRKKGAEARAKLRQVVSDEIDHIYLTTPPEVLLAALEDYFKAKFPLGEVALGFFSGQIEAILTKYTSTESRAKVKEWFYGRLGINH